MGLSVKGRIWIKNLYFAKGNGAVRLINEFLANVGRKAC